MSIHTLCLDILILLVTFNPVILAQNAMYMIYNGMVAYDMNFFMKVLIAILSVIVVLIAIVNPNIMVPNLPTNFYWYLVAIIAVPATVALELGIGYIMLLLQGKKVKGISLIESWKHTSTKLVLLSAVVALLEEIIFRQLWFQILYKDFKIYFAIVILISAIAYALNHIFMGKIVFIQKIFSGIVYGSIFYFSGLSIIIPVITHCMQNIIILLKGRD